MTRNDKRNEARRVGALFASLLLVGAVALVGCDDDDEAMPTAPAPAPAPAPPPAPEPAPEPTPPPPEPDPQAVPFVASVTVPDGELAFEPDDDTNRATASAEPNLGITVGVTAPALLQPLYIPEASPRGLAPGEQQPFEFVAWAIRQSALLSTGASFAVTRVQVAAGQEPVPTSDVLYFTCGPFACTEPSATRPSGPPAITADTLLCADWDPAVTLDIGVINNSDNDAFDNPGMDFGWRYTAGLPFTAEHSYGSQTRQPQSAGSQDASATLQRLDRGSLEGAAPSASRVLNRDNVCPPPEGRQLNQPDRSGDRLSRGRNFGARIVDQNMYTSSAGGIREPGECFTFPMDDRGGLFSEYTLTLTPTGTVSWGEIAWEAFDDLACQPVSFRAADQVDVCALLEEEVNALPVPEAVGAVLTRSDEPIHELAAATADDPLQTTPHNYLMGLNLDYRKARQRRFTAMYYEAGRTEYDLYDPTFDQRDVPPGNRFQNSHYYQVVTGVREMRDGLLPCPDCGKAPWQTPMQFARVNAKIAAEIDTPAREGTADLVYLPLSGDFGKTDSLTWETQCEPGGQGRFLSGFESGSDTLPDNYMQYSRPDFAETGRVAVDCLDSEAVSAFSEEYAEALVWDGFECSAADNTRQDALCDSRQSWETSVTFVDGWDLGCEVEKSYTVSCSWDADGGNQPRSSRLHPLVMDDYISCSVEEN